MGELEPGPDFGLLHLFQIGGLQVFRRDHFFRFLGGAHDVLVHVPGAGNRQGDRHRGLRQIHGLLRRGGIVGQCQLFPVLGIDHGLVELFEPAKNPADVVLVIGHHFQTGAQLFRQVRQQRLQAGDVRRRGLGLGRPDQVVHKAPGTSQFLGVFTVAQFGEDQHIGPGLAQQLIDQVWKFPLVDTFGDRPGGMLPGSLQALLALGRFSGSLFSHVGTPAGLLHEAGEILAQLVEQHQVVIEL